MTQTSDVAMRSRVTVDTDVTLSHDTDVGRVRSTLGAVDHSLGQLVVGTAA